MLSVESRIDVSAPQGGKSTQHQRLGVEQFPEILLFLFWKKTIHMSVRPATAKKFGKYKNLDFDFVNLPLQQDFVSFQNKVELEHQSRCIHICTLYIYTYMQLAGSATHGACVHKTELVASIWWEGHPTFLHCVFSNVPLVRVDVHIYAVWVHMVHMVHVCRG